MSVIYPTLNFREIPCCTLFERGLIRGHDSFFYLRIRGACGPPAMEAWLVDLFGHPRYGFVLATALAALLFGGALYNRLVDQTSTVLLRSDRIQYGQKQITHVLKA